MTVRALSGAALHPRLARADPAAVRVPGYRGRHRMPRIVLYGPPLAPFVQKVVRALMLKKLPFELVEPQSLEDYRRWNPETGLLPVIDIDGTRVPDSVKILDTLDEHFPEPPLVSSHPTVAASQRRLELWVGETFFFYWMRWLHTHMEASPAPAESGPAGRGPLARLGILGRAVRNPEALLASSPGEGMGPEFERRVDDLVKFLGGRPFFFADHISRADLTAYAFLQSLRSNVVPGGRHVLEARPALIGHMQRVEQETGPGV